MSFIAARTEPPQLLRPRSGPVLHVATSIHEGLAGAGGILVLHAEQGDPVHRLALFEERGPQPLAGAAGTPRASGGLAQPARPGSAEWELWGVPPRVEVSEEEVSELARRLARRILELAPATIYAPWHGELGLDAFVVCWATSLAVELADFEGLALGYEVSTPLVPAWVCDVSAAWERKGALLGARSTGSGPDRLRVAEGLAIHRSSLLPPGGTHGEAFTGLMDLRIRVPRSAARAGARA